MNKRLLIFTASIASIGIAILLYKISNRTKRLSKIPEQYTQRIELKDITINGKHYENACIYVKPGCDNYNNDKFYLNYDGNIFEILFSDKDLEARRNDDHIGNVFFDNIKGKKYVFRRTNTDLDFMFLVDP